MALAEIISGLAALGGTAAAIVKLFRDDKQSRYPPEILQMKQMMKMGIPPSMLIQQPQKPTALTYGQQPQIQNQLAQILQQYQTQQLLNQVLGQMNQNTPRRMTIPLYPIPTNVYGTTSPVFQMPQLNLPQFSQPYVRPTLTAPVVAIPNVSAKPLWDSPADGGCNNVASVQYPPVVPQAPPVQQPQVNHMPLPIMQQQQLSVQWYQPPREPTIQYSNRQLTWSNSNAYGVDTSGLKSFISRLDYQNNAPSSLPENYVGNTRDW